LQSSTGIRPFIPNFNRTEFGTYGIVNYDISDKFSVDAGVRYDFSASSSH
jgi:iron complex outermembrane receptor protein